MREEAVLFGRATPLVGVLTFPADSMAPDGLPAAILLNAGIVSRVGPNRVYVKLARTLAALGLPVLRFDLSGIGDSPVRRDHLPFYQSALSETKEAMDYVTQVTGVGQFVLTGICSGANLSYRTALRDPRVVGAALLNPRDHLHGGSKEIRSAIRSRALSRHYWRIALFSSFSAKHWSNLLAGRARRGAVMKAARGLWPGGLSASRTGPVSSVADEAEARLRSLAERGTRVLHVYSEGDEGMDYLQAAFGHRLRAWRAEGLLELEVIRGTNHTFTLLWSQERLLEVVCDWVRSTVRE
jgi:alpha-beta hydrolase superfamily lysophospholipase